MKLILIVDSEQTLNTVLVIYLCLLFNDYVQIFPGYHLVNKCNIIANNTKKNICECIFSKKRTYVVHQPFSTKTTDQKTQHFAVMKASLLII